MAGLSRCCARSNGQNLADTSQPFATDAILYRRSAAIRDIANFKTDVLAAPSHKATSNGLGYAALSSAVAVYIACVLNGGFWSAFRGTVDPASLFEYLFIGATFLILVALCTLLLTLFAIPYVFRPFAIFLLLTAAAISYFMNEYGTVFDANMLRNVLETNQSEALELVTWKFAGHLTLLGVLPSAVVWSVPISRHPPAVIVARNVKTGSICALVIASLSFPFLMNFLSVFRENKRLVHSVTPINAIQAVSKYYIKRSKSVGSQVNAIGLDARKSDAWSQRPRKSVLVIVLGETARSDHFSINGYSKPTTPRLSAVPGLISFTNVRSCGTDTADSVPCMFSNLGRANFTPERAAAQEGLLDVIQRARLSVLWRDNQSGCKGVCARVPAESLGRSNSVFHCTELAPQF